MCIEAKEAATWWTLDPVSLGVVLVPSAIYFWGWRAARRRAPSDRCAKPAGAHGLRPWEISCFIAGELSLLLALVSPLDRLSDILFSAHMTQHELIMLVAPPLLLLGRPWVALLWALPDAARARLTVLMGRRRSRALWRAVTHPLVVLLVHGAVVWAWHAPVLYEAALRSELVHGVQHASFFGTAALFWWAMLRGRYGRLGYGLAVAFVFATAMHTSVLGALITVAERLWYPMYADRGRPWDIDVLDDQTLAGLIMWIPAGILLTIMALALFAAWLGEAARRVAAAERRRVEQPATHRIA